MSVATERSGGTTAIRLFTVEISDGQVEDLRRRIGLDAEDVKGQHDRQHWPALRAKMAAIFKSRTRDAWCAILEGTHSCVTPVLTMDEAPHHPHLRARNAFHQSGEHPRPSAARLPIRKGC